MSQSLQNEFDEKVAKYQNQMRLINGATILRTPQDELLWQQIQILSSRLAHKQKPTTL